MPKCKCDWCMLLPLPGKDACALHTELPVMSTHDEDGKLIWIESPAEWTTRLNRQRNKQKKAAEKAAESDQKLKQRGAK